MRIKLNKLLNGKLSAEQSRTLFLKCEEAHLSGITMQPQDMHIWAGMEMQGCTRAAHKKVVTGVLYTVLGWDDEHVWIRMRPEYCTTAEVMEDVPEVADDPDPILEVTPEQPTKHMGFKMQKGDQKLSHREAAKLLRLQHANVISNVQGRTIRDKHVCMMDLERKHFTIRHLIVAGSGVTHGKYLHAMTLGQQHRFKASGSIDDLRALDVEMTERVQRDYVAIPVDEPWIFGDDPW